MLYGGGLVGLVVLGFWIWAIFDVITTDESLCRNLPKGAWLMIVLFFSTIGGIAWLVVGRPENASFRIGDPNPRPARPRVLGPEDGPRYDPRLDQRTGISETERERLLRSERERYLALDAELDRRIEEKMRKQQELEAWEADLRRREAEIAGGEDETRPDEGHSAR